MSNRHSLVSIGIPVYNGESTLEPVIRSVLAQHHERIEVVISDNASTDRTEQLCRDLALADERLVYHRQPQNLGILNNFVSAMRLSKGTFFRWLGDDDWIAPQYVSRCIEAFENDGRLILVTTQIRYTRLDGSPYVRSYHGHYRAESMRVDDPIERFGVVLRYLVNGMPVDPLYGLVRREAVAPIDRRNTLGEDEVFAAKLALAGSWGHIPEVLAHRRYRTAVASEIAKRLGVPGWQAYLVTTLQCREMLRAIHEGDFTAAQRWKARALVAGHYVGRHSDRWAHRVQRLLHLLAPLNPERHPR